MPAADLGARTPDVRIQPQIGRWQRIEAWLGRDAQIGAERQAAITELLNAGSARVGGGAAGGPVVAKPTWPMTTRAGDAADCM